MLFTVELSGEPPRWTSELSPAAAVGFAKVLCALLVTRLWCTIRETDSAAGRERKEKNSPTSVCSVYLFCSCLHGFLFWASSLFDLFSTTPPDLVLLSRCVWEPVIWKQGFRASPNNSLSDRHPPCTLQKPLTNTFNSASVGAWNQQWPPLVCNPSEPVWSVAARVNKHRSFQPIRTHYVLCFWIWICTLSRIDSAAPLLLCCESWQESPSLTRLSWKYFNCWKKEAKYEPALIYISLAPGSIRKMLSPCLQVYCKYSWSPEDEPLRLCWLLDLPSSTSSSWTAVSLGEILRKWHMGHRMTYFDWHLMNNMKFPGWQMSSAAQ